MQRIIQAEKAIVNGLDVIGSIFSDVTMTATNVSTGDDPTALVWDTILAESEPIYNDTTGIWTIPDTVIGTKMAQLNWTIESGGTTARYAIVNKNGAWFRLGPFYPNGNTGVLHGSVNIPVVAGDEIYQTIFHTGGVVSINQNGQQFNYASLLIV